MIRVCIFLFAILSSLDATDGQDEITFVDKTAELKLSPANGAACWADFNNDGWVDLCDGSQIWVNQHGKSFKATQVAGSGVAADFDNDGFVDFFLWSKLRLLRNNKGTAFEPFPLPELPKSVSHAACWADLNNDGFVDLFIGGYEDWNAGITWPYIVLMNEGGNSFRVAQSESKNRARGVTACDFDQDADVDVYVSNYRLQPNVLWLNDGTGQLTDAAADKGALATSHGFGGGHSIGAVFGDFNNDGLFDIFAGNFAHVDGRGDQPKSRFLKNLGKEAGYRFEDRGPGGVHYQESYASPAAADYDNDGKLDLFFTTVYAVASFGRPNHPVLFRGTGDFVVADVSKPTGLSGLGATYQAAWADFDNDGDQDLITAGRLFQNQGPSGNWLKIRLQGDGHHVNRSAIGTQVFVQQKEETLTRQVEAGTGEGNQNDLTLHFGLGETAQPVKVRILWPNGTEQELHNVKLNSVLDVKYAKQ